MSETLMDVASPVICNFAAMAAGHGAAPSWTGAATADPIAFSRQRDGAPVARPGLAPHHVWVAGTRLRMGLIAWAAPIPVAPLPVGPAAGRDPAVAVAMLVADPATRGLLADAAVKAACALLLATSDELSARLDALTADLGAIEAWREGIFDKAKALVRRLAVLRGGEPGQERLVRQCGLLLIPALSRMQARLHEADCCVDDVVGALGDMAGAQALLRSCACTVKFRDGWANMLAVWDGAGVADDLPGVLLQTHTFLVANSMGDTSRRP